MFDAAVASAQPAVCVPPNLPSLPKGRTIVVGAGKAASAMAQAVERNWAGPLEGVIATRYGHALPCEHIRVLEAAHPVPDTAGAAAAEQILQQVDGLNSDDLVLVLLSGGGSALLTLPAPGISMEDKIAVNLALLASGAPIHEMNCVRKHLSAIKGGRLAATAAPANVVTLVISDVPGDDPATIASGPSVADPTTRIEALEILHRHNIDIPHQIYSYLESKISETPKPNLPLFAASDVRIIAAPALALAAAENVAKAAGYSVQSLGDEIEGHADVVARQHAELARSLPSKSVLLSGGELTVSLKGNGRGGPNGEYLLALAIALDGEPDITAMACDTDGIDGSEDNAGAIIDPTTLTRARRSSLNGAQLLANNDSYGFFSRLGDLVMTGPTQTNVNDFRAIIRD